MLIKFYMIIKYQRCDTKTNVVILQQKDLLCLFKVELAEVYNTYEDDSLIFVVG